MSPNDSAPAALYKNNGDGTLTDIGVEAGCAFSVDGKPQAGMGVSAGDYDRDGWFDIFKTNFSGDTSTLYRNITGSFGETAFEDMTFQAGIGQNTKWLGWGCGFVDFDNNGWLDVFLVNGHVYPEVEKLTTEAGYAQRKVLYCRLTIKIPPQSSIVNRQSSIVNRQISPYHLIRNSARNFRSYSVRTTSFPWRHPVFGHCVSHGQSLHPHREQ